jgi:hypothetical protein
MHARSFRWAAVVFGLGSFALAGSPSPPGMQVIRWDHVWKYEASGTNLGRSPWISPGYDDSAWPSGQSVFATFSEPLPAGTTNNTMLLLNPTGTDPILTIYFRTWFQLDTVGPMTMIFSNLIDDGAVFYLNGRELKRVGMPEGFVDNTTRATRQGDVVASYGYDVFTIDYPPVEPGLNLLAVELHNVTPTSGDLVFGSSVWLAINESPCLGVPPPRSVAVLECKNTNLVSVFDTSFSVSLQWFKDEIAIPDATNATYTITTAGLDDAGTYTCRATYPTATCDQSFNVSVIADDQPLYVIEATGLLNRTNILVRFSLPVEQTSAEDIFNYTLEDLAIESAVLTSNSHQLILTTEPRQPGRVYTLSVTDVQPVAELCPPPIMAYEPVRLNLEQEVLRFDAEWKYEQSGSDLGTAWRMPQYDDSAWASGRALLGVETTNILALLEAQGATWHTPLALTNVDGTEINTYYFRAMVDVRFAMASSTLTLRHVVDDGAVFYVNGAEAGRFNMPGGPISYPTFAPMGMPEGVIRAIELAGFVAGTNVIAVEVHKRGAGDTDVLFGAQLIGVASGDSAPTLAIRRNANGTLTLFWAGRALLQEAPSPGAWSTSADQTNPQTITPSDAARFYRLVQ